MGSFDVCCGLTSLPINSGDRAVLIPLVSADSYHDDHFEKTTRGSGLVGYVNGLFQPAGLPIIGYYADYGRLDPDENQYEYWSEIERVTGVSYLDFLEAMRENGKYDKFTLVINEDLSLSLSGMWIREDAYLQAIRRSPENFRGSYNLPIEVLEAMGLQYSHDGGDERYNRVYVHPNHDNIVICSDGTYNKVLIASETKEIKMVYTPQCLIDVYKRDGFDLEFDNVDMSEILFRKCLREIDESLTVVDDPPSRLNGDPERIKEWISYRQLSNKRRQIENLQNFVGLKGDMCSYNPLAPDRWDEEFIDLRKCQKGLVDMAKLRSTMFGINRIFMPTSLCTQHGDWDSSLKWAKVILNIAQAEVDQWREENGYDEEED